MDEPKRAPSPSQETLPTVFEGRQRSAGAPKSEVQRQLQPGDVLGKYRIVRHLGQGGMGAVYEASHLEIGKEVALKVLSRELATDPRAHARFLREALAASRLDHPYVVNVTDFASAGDVAYLVMELLRGEDLGAYLDRNPRGLFVEESVDIIMAVAAGVFAAHQSGVVHRDLKPRNIFLARNHMKDIEPKVLDFGISKVNDGVGEQSLTDSGAIVGTAQYVSPEHVRGAPTDARSDQYALGVVLYECLTGHRPYEGQNTYAILKSIADGRFAPPSALRSGIPPLLEKHLLRAMSPEPQNRFASVHEMGCALLEFASAKKRVMWAEYFKQAVTQPISPAGAASHTFPLHEERRHDERRHDERQRQRDDAESSPQLPALTTAAAATPVRRNRGWLLGLLVLVVGGAVYGLGLFDSWLPVVSGWANDVRANLRTMVAPESAAPAPPPSVAVQTAPPPAPIPLPPPPPPVTATAAPTPTSAPAPASAPAVVVKDVTVEVVSDPPGATVFVNRTPVMEGLTPLSLSLARSSDAHTIAVRLTGHKLATQILTPDRDQTLRFDLVPVPPAPAPASKAKPRSRPATRAPNDPAPPKPVPAAEPDPPPNDDRYEKVDD